jgi:hypothetical protein
MCDDDLPHFIMLLGGMLMVKTGVSDHPQATPLLVPEQRCGFSME